MQGHHQRCSNPPKPSGQDEIGRETPHRSWSAATTKGPKARSNRDCIASGQRRIKVERIVDPLQCLSLRQCDLRARRVIPKARSIDTEHDILAVRPVLEQAVQVPPNAGQRLKQGITVHRNRGSAFPGARRGLATQPHTPTQGVADPAGMKPAEDGTEEPHRAKAYGVPTPLTVS